MAVTKERYEHMYFLKEIEAVKRGNTHILKEHKWLMFLSITHEKHINLERVNSTAELTHNYVLNYVEKTLKILQQCGYPNKIKEIIAQVLIWSEVAKTGLLHQRKQWRAAGYNLYIHNEASADVFLEYVVTQSDYQRNPKQESLVATLIRTHGLIGQYVRGEVSLSSSLPLRELVAAHIVTSDELSDHLNCLNYCIIAAVDEALWNRIRRDVELAIEQIVSNQSIREVLSENNDEKDYTDNTASKLVQRVKKLRYQAILQGENYETYDMSHVEVLLATLFEHTTLWYVEAALSEFSFDEFIKIMMLCAVKLEEAKSQEENQLENKHTQSIQPKNVAHLSFELFMHGIYYDYQKKKKVNIYKKRIIEHFLKGISREDILAGKINKTPHIEELFSTKEGNDSTLFFDVQFSCAAEKLIDFCVEAERSEVLYEKAIILLYDLFGLRHDQYDRFNEEERYLSTMNQSIDYKRILLTYITGKTVLDIGPGGGALMDLIEATYPEKKVIGIDISQNVIETLSKKKQIENKSWDVVHGNALDLKTSFEVGTIDTIIFCSIIHELFSYIEFEGKKFNHSTIKTALKSAFDVLPVGGRIIIRDGIMSEPEDTIRRIRFLSEDGFDFLKNYCKDFQGRSVSYEQVGQNEVVMKINDAMEFLYTYTWGEKSYVHEIQEQFGYYTPSGFRECMNELFGTQAKFVEFKHFLQEGYTLALSPKIEFMDMNQQPVRLPDSTCIIVIEKLRECTVTN